MEQLIKLTKKLQRPGIYVLIFLASASLIIFTPGCISQEERSNRKENEQAKLPEKLLCRIQDGKNPDLMVMTLGNVNTPLADGYFYPYEDKVVLKNGQEIENYYKEHLGIKYYTPLDKSNFPLPPSGWCSWYYYYQELTQEEVEKNAVWLAENLKEYGAEYCQIDDAWQGVGHGMGENRDWTTIDHRFSKGMGNLARSIKNLGLKPALWIAPHGQSNLEVVQKSGAFLVDQDGKSLSSTWVGDFLLDPSKPEAHKYLKELFTLITQDWGYENLKLDGLPTVVREYKNKKSLMKFPADPDDLFRNTLQTIRETVGPDCYLLGSWGTPLEGMGLLNGSRTGGDTLLGWDGFLVAVEATMNYYFLHNIAWYSDPDVILVRYPLTLDMARAWATLQGLTGQALMASDRMYDLPAERVEILKRIFPAVDIRPIDLFPSSGQKRIWDLKINHLGRQYDLVACFNYDLNKTVGIELKWADLGLEENALYHIYNFWDKEYLGSWEKGIYLEIPPASVKVLTLLKDNGQPQLISTSRHITQGWVDLKSLSYDSARLSIKGTSQIIKGDPYQLTFVYPRNRRNLRIKKASVPGHKFSVYNYDGWSVVSIESRSTKPVPWEVCFEEQESYYNYPVATPERLRAYFDDSKIVLTWEPSYYNTAGCFVSVDGSLYLYSPTNRCQISNIDLNQEHIVEVKSVWLDGTTSQKAASIRIRPEDVAKKLIGNK